MVVPYLTRLRTLDQPGITPRRRSRFEPREGVGDFLELPVTRGAPAEPVLVVGDTAVPDPLTPQDDPRAGFPRPRPQPTEPLVPAPAEVGPTPVRNAASPLIPAPALARDSAPPPVSPTRRGTRPDPRPDRPAAAPVEPAQTVQPSVVDRDSAPPPQPEVPVVASPPDRNERQPPALQPSAEQSPAISRSGPADVVRVPHPASTTVDVKAAALQRTATALGQATPVYPQRAARPDPRPGRDTWSADADADPAYGHVPPPTPGPDPTHGSPAAPTRSEPTTVHVSIGRVEVTGPATAPTPLPRRAPVSPTSTLDAYLSARRGRQVG